MPGVSKKIDTYSVLLFHRFYSLPSVFISAIKIFVYCLSVTVVVFLVSGFTQRTEQPQFSICA